jgi:hypothetical protein
MVNNRGEIHMKSEPSLENASSPATKPFTMATLAGGAVVNKATRCRGTQLKIYEAQMGVEGVLGSCH